MSDLQHTPEAAPVIRGARLNQLGSSLAAGGPVTLDQMEMIRLLVQLIWKFVSEWPAEIGPSPQQVIEGMMPNWGLIEQGCAEDATYEEPVLRLGLLLAMNAGVVYTRTGFAQQVMVCCNPPMFWGHGKEVVVTNDDIRGQKVKSGWWNGSAATPW